MSSGNDEAHADLYEVRDHSKHGRGTKDNGPDDPDCPCRHTLRQGECAKAGCGFCKVSEKMDHERRTAELDGAPQIERGQEAK